MGIRGNGAGHVTVGTSLPDPTDLEAIRARLADDGLGRRRPLGLGSVTIAKDALERLGDEIDAVRRTGPVVLLVDETPMTRDGEDLKARVAATLQDRFGAGCVVLRANGAELHADEHGLKQADEAIGRRAPVVPGEAVQHIDILVADADQGA